MRLSPCTGTCSSGGVPTPITFASGRPPRRQDSGGAAGLGAGPHARAGAHGQASPGLLGDLISVLLSEGLADEAWSTAAGEPGQVSDSQWLQLISLREGEHPSDVLGPLARLIELSVEQTSDKYRYPKAVKALRRLREDYERTGDATGFGVYLAGLRERHRRKYSLIAKLDAAFGTEDPGVTGEERSRRNGGFDLV